MQTKRLIDLKPPFWHRHLPLALLTFLLIIPLTCVLRPALTLRIYPQSQAILVLGGGQDREIYAAQLAHHHPNLPIWVSSGTPPKQATAIFPTFRR